MDSERHKAARDLLAFHAMAGVDVLVGELPVNRIAEADIARGAAVAKSGAPSSAPHAPSPDPPAAPDIDGPPDPDAGSSYDGGDRDRASGHDDRDGGDMPAPPDPARRPPLRGLKPARDAAQASPATSAPAPMAPDVAVMAAREAAGRAATLEELRVILEGFEGCALKGMARQCVFADGNPQARVMFVGEAPGREEDIEGLPFVGRSGQLLDRMLAAIGLDRQGAYIANIIPWRPPGNRTPTPQESAICLPFIRRQIELADPDILVCLGGPSMQTLLGVKEGIRRTRGRWFPYDTGTREIRAIPTFHPAYLLRSPLEKRHAWKDFLAVKKALGEG